MMFLKDGRTELYQWDTGREIALNGECSQFHFSNKVFGSTIDVDATFSDGISTAKIPDFLLQSILPLNVYAYVGTDTDGYTKISKQFNIIRRNKPADYVFTPTDQMTIEDIKTIAQSVRDDANAGKFDGFSPSARVEKTDSGVKITITDKDGTTTENVSEGVQGPEGQQGPQGDTGAKGDKGDKGETGTSGKSAYQIALDNGYTGTEQEWLASLKGTDGKNGTDGKDGADGVSPTVKTEPIENGHKVTITDKDGAKSFDVLNGKGGQGSSVQSDWSVNDETNPAFVKNRFGGYYKKQLKKFIDNQTIASETMVNFPKVLDGDNCLIICDGVSMECMAKKVVNNPAFEGALYIGNDAINGGADSGEIFVFVITPDTAILEKAMFLSMDDLPHTITASANVSEPVQIPPVFFPDSVGSEEIAPPSLSTAVWTLQKWHEIYNKFLSGKKLYVKHSEGISLVVGMRYNPNVGNWLVGFGGSSGQLYRFTGEQIESIDLLSAINGDGIILKSSSPSSTKQFKITVDDTGTLHTEEIING